MFQCEYPDHNINDYPMVKNDYVLNIIYCMDAPTHIQMNWNNWVLWRERMTYPPLRCSVCGDELIPEWSPEFCPSCDFKDYGP